MGVFDDKMTGLADVFRRKFSTEETLTIDAMSQLLFNADIGEGGSGGVDVSGVTATPATVLNTVKFVDNLGRLLDGEIETVTPLVTDNVFSVAKGYVSDNVTLEVDEMAAPTVSGNQVTLHKGYNPQEQTITVEGGTDIPDGYADVSGVTATPNDVLMTARFVDSNGELQDGAIQPVTPYLTDNVFEVEEGFIGSTTLTVPEAATPTVNGNQVTIYKGYNRAEQTITVENSGGGDGTVSEFGYWTEDGKFQKVDLSGSQPVNVGAAETVADGAVFLFATGQAEPDYEITVPGGGGIEFYECATYTPNADAYIKYTVTLSDAPDANANTTYERKRFVEKPDPDSYGTTAKWQAENGYYIEENYGYGEWNYYIKDNNNYTKYAADMLTSRVTDFRTISWQDQDIYEPVTLTFSAVQEENMPATTEGWTGRKVTQDAETGAWITAEEITTGLTVTHLKPKVGEIYSADTTIQVRKMFDGSVILIPSDGLVFYAPLKGDYVELINKTQPVSTAGNFTTYKGMECLYMDGKSGECIEYPTNADLPQQQMAVSLVGVFCLYGEKSSWRMVNSIGNSSTELYIGESGGRICDVYDSDVEFDRWYSAIITRNSTGDAYLYIDGKFVGDVRQGSEIPPSPSVVIGNILRDNKSFTWQGYLGPQAVYNRELTSAEVLEIHNTLMEDVQQ